MCSVAVLDVYWKHYQTISRRVTHWRVTHHYTFPARQCLPGKRECPTRTAQDLLVQWYMLCYDNHNLYCYPSSTQTRISQSTKMKTTSWAGKIKPQFYHYSPLFWLDLFAIAKNTWRRRINIHDAVANAKYGQRNSPSLFKSTKQLNSSTSRYF